MAHQLSASNPLPKRLEALESLTESSSLLHKASSGTKTQEQSRSARAYLVSKDRPHRQRTSPGRANLETVIGTDDRRRILDTDLTPWRMICALRIRGSAGSLLLGTGWLVGPKTLITAGHCVHHDDLGGNKWATEIEVSPGRNGDEFPFKTVRATRFSAHATWVKEQAADFDIGCIHLDTDIGSELGWFGMGVLPADQLQGHSVNVSGYPGDRGGGKEQYFHSNSVLKVTDRRVFYDVDTYGGQSGSPVWLQAKPDDPPVVVGIHAYGVMGSLVANSAPRIDQNVFNLITSWIEQGHAPPVA